MNQCMQAIAAREAGGRTQHVCRCSYLQIYNEQVLDLLDPDSSKQYSLSHSNQGVHVQGLHEEVVLNGALMHLFLHVQSSFEHLAFHRVMCFIGSQPGRMPAAPWNVPVPTQHPIFSIRTVCICYVIRHVCA